MCEKINLGPFVSSKLCLALLFELAVGCMQPKYSFACQSEYVH